MKPIPLAIQHELDKDRDRAYAYPERTGRYPYISLWEGYAEAMLKLTIRQFIKRRKRRPETFLEVGCGFGRITDYAQTCLGMRATGIDIVPKYVKWSKDHLKGTFLRRDALKFKQYNQFDVVYFYQPFYDCDLAQQFGCLLAEECTGFIAPVFGLYGTPLYPSKTPFYCVGKAFSPFDGARKELVYPA